DVQQVGGLIGSDDAVEGAGGDANRRDDLTATARRCFPGSGLARRTAANEEEGGEQSGGDAEADEARRTRGSRCGGQIWLPRPTSWPRKTARRSRHVRTQILQGQPWIRVDGVNVLAKGFTRCGSADKPNSNDNIQTLTELRGKIKLL